MSAATVLSSENLLLADSTVVLPVLGVEVAVHAKLPLPSKCKTMARALRGCVTVNLATRKAVPICIAPSTDMKVQLLSPAKHPEMTFGVFILLKLQQKMTHGDY